MRNPVSRFAFVQSDLGMKRSQFKRPHRHLTTISAGRLYPLMVDEVLPGDTYTVDMSSLIRMSTPIHPVMDNCYFDCYWFFVPNRIVWDHWKEFMGEYGHDPFAPNIEYSVPKLTGPEQIVDPSLFYGVAPKSMLDYMGIPVNALPREINALPVRGFCTIWNEWFRDQNLQSPIDVSIRDANIPYYVGVEVSEYNQSDYYVHYCANGGCLPPVNKYHDYFTSALASPQKGAPVPIPLSGFAPVYGNDISFLSYGLPHLTPILGEQFTDSLLGFNGNDQLSVSTDEANGAIGEGEPIQFQNLGADLSNIMGTYATINDLRYAFQVQKFLEADNRGGTRYREILKNHFNVTSPDASIQIPEFLGGKRIPINIAQVLQTSATDDTSPQGNTAAYSLTSDKFSAFTKSFTEHGFIFCVGCIRTEHTYQNGIEKFWSRSGKFDYYFPEFANISEQPIYNRELFNYKASNIGGSIEDLESLYRVGDDIFGYQEAWADYRYKPNRVSGEFRSDYVGSLDIWHYADDYQTQPMLTSDWISETRANIDRTLAVSSDLADQFICDFYFDLNTTRVMPITSIPGLADHH